MTDLHAYAAAIGTLAGLVNLSSSIPQVYKNIRRPTDAARQCPIRNALQATGNTLWLVYAILLNAFVMVIFATLGTGIALIILVQVLRARRKNDYQGNKILDKLGDLV